MLPPPPRSTLFPYTTLFRSHHTGLLGEKVLFGLQTGAERGHLRLDATQLRDMERQDGRRSNVRTADLQRQQPGPGARADPLLSENARSGVDHRREMQVDEVRKRRAESHR